MYLSWTEKTLKDVEKYSLTNKKFNPAFATA